MIQVVTNNNDCSTCTHNNVCAYKSVYEKINQRIHNDPKIRDVMINSPISCDIKCTEYISTISAVYKIRQLESNGIGNIALCKDTTLNGVQLPQTPEPEVYKETFGSLERVNTHETKDLIRSSHL